MMKPDWDEAPEGATHWDTVDKHFCDKRSWWIDQKRYFLLQIPEHTGWETDRCIPRPVESAGINTMNPDWTKASPEATHWDPKHGLFCDVNGWWLSDGMYFNPLHNQDWGTERYTPRPVDSKDKTEELT